MPLPFKIQNMAQDPTASDPYLRIQCGTRVLENTGIHSNVLLECSGRYRRTCFHWHTKDDVVSVQSDNPIAVKKFIDGCQGIDMELDNWQNAKDVMILCDDWQVPSVKDKVITFLMSNKDILVDFLSDMSFPRDIIVDRPIFEFWPYFLQFCDTRRFELLHSLGLNLLLRICDNYRDLICQNMHIVFPFLVDALNKDPTASLLFDLFKVDNFTDTNIETLIRHRNYCATKLSRDYLTTALELRKIRSELDSAKQTIARQKCKIRQLKGRLTSAQATIRQTNSRPQFSQAPSQRNPVPNSDAVKKQLNGIIAKLTRECGGNVNDNGRVLVTASSDTRDHKPANVVDLYGDTYFRSENVPNSWLRWEFKDPVALVAYAMRSCVTLGRDFSHPRCWELQGSNDGTTWKLLDQRKENDDLNGNGLIARFQLDPAPTERFRFIQLVQTGPNHANNDSLILTAVEMFET